MANETDDLVARAQGGERDAYEALFARVAERLLLYVRLRLGPRLAAQLEPVDVLQEIYLQAHRDFGHYRQQAGGSFSGWLYRIADNRLRDLSGHFDAQKRQALGGAAHGSAVLDSLRAQARGPATECDQQDRERALAEALAELDEQEREALLLRHFHGLSQVAIAKRLDTSETSARRALARGQIKLGIRLESLQP